MRYLIRQECLFQFSFKIGQELDIEFVADSSLGRGFLTGQIKHFEDLSEDDARRYLPALKVKTSNEMSN